jgi:hypothetical protein
MNVQLQGKAINRKLLISFVIVRVKKEKKRRVKSNFA